MNFLRDDRNEWFERALAYRPPSTLLMPLTAFLLSVFAFVSGSVMERVRVHSVTHEAHELHAIRSRFDQQVVLARVREGTLHRDVALAEDIRSIRNTTSTAVDRVSKLVRQTPASIWFDHLRIDKHTMSLDAEAPSFNAIVGMLRSLRGFWSGRQVSVRSIMRRSRTQAHLLRFTLRLDSNDRKRGSSHEHAT